MHRNMRKTASTLFITSILTIAAGAAAHAAGHHYEGAIRGFEAEQNRNPAPRGCVLFTGSSSIRGWHTLAPDMRPRVAINRGFGGSQLSDVLHFYDRLIPPVKPKIIVLYCGENDIAAGVSPQTVLERFEEVVARTAKALPKTRMIYISMKPSPSRAKLWPKFVEGNELIRKHCLSAKNVSYLDVGPFMLSDAGEPLKAIYSRDMLHMNGTGYMIWRALVHEAIDQRLNRWADTTERFALRDMKRSSSPGVTLFTGSSSIAMWGGKLMEDMKPISCINRGFGGSQISDVLLHFDRIVTPHRPAAVVLYCGENDIAAGKSPQKVFDDFREFVKRVRDEKPGVPVYFISMKPSPSRWRMWGKFVEGNEMIENYCDQERDLTYIDVGDAMLGGDGKPKPTIWLKDKLHMNRTGYRIWTTIIKEALLK